MTHALNPILLKELRQAVRSRFVSGALLFFLFSLLAVVAGVLLSPERRAFAKPWIWLGGALAGLVFLPNLLWNVRHGWPFLV